MVKLKSQVSQSIPEVSALICLIWVLFFNLIGFAKLFEAH